MILDNYILDMFYYKYIEKKVHLHLSIYITTFKDYIRINTTNNITSDMKKLFRYYHFLNNITIQPCCNSGYYLYKHNNMIEFNYNRDSNDDLRIIFQK